MRYFYLFILLLVPYFLSAQVQLQFKSGDTPVSNLGFQATACDQNKGYTTDAEGKASINLPSNCSSLRLQFQDITYGNLDTVFTITSPTQAILISLTERQLTIDEVRVAGYVSNIKEDARGREYQINTEKFPLNTPIAKALQRLPDFVRVNDGVRIAGKTSTPTYYLDGKQVPEILIQYLDIQEVDRVVVHDVSADPSKDAGGEVYIYRKKQTASRLYGRLKVGPSQHLNNDRMGYSIHPSFGFQSPKFEINASVNHYSREGKGEEIQKYLRTGLPDSVINLLKRNHSEQTSASLQLNYAFTEKFSAQIGGSLFRYDMWIKNNTLDNSYSSKYHSDDLEAIGSLILQYDYNPENRFYLMGSYDYTHDIAHLWETSRDFPLKQKEHDIAGEFRGVHDNVGTLWSVTHSLEYAYRFIARTGSNDGTLTPTSQAQRAIFEDLMRFPFPLSLYLGCSLDYDRYDYGIKQLDMWHVLPIAKLSYGGTWGRVGFNYSYKVQKPSIGYLDPRPRHIDYQKATIGNPNLRASTTHSYTLGYSKRFVGGHSISLFLSYSTYANLVTPLYTSSDFISRYFNAGERQVFSPRLSYQGQILDKIYINVYGGVNYVAYSLYDRYKVLSRGKEQKGWATVANINFDYEITKRLRASTHLGHWGRSYKLYSSFLPVADWGVDVSYTFLKDRSLELSAYAGELLNLWLKDESRRDLYNFLETSVSERYPSFSFHVRYSFGKRFESRISNMSIDTSDDQLDRIK